MTFTCLSEPLRPTAEAAIKHFSTQLGIPKSKFRIEQPIHVSVCLRPTAYVITRDFHYFCIEVAEKPYLKLFDAFIADCTQLSLPVKLMVVMPCGCRPCHNYKQLLMEAKAKCVGVVEVSDSSAKSLNEPISLSLAALRRIQLQDYPSKYRQALSEAQTTFLNVNPVKGCHVIYDEIEALTRRIAEKTYTEGLWRKPETGEKTPKIHFEKDSWARIVKTLMKWLKFSKIKQISPNLNDTLLASVLAATPRRNESGHKLTKPADVKRRDTRLRTHFEHAADLLLDLIQASRGLKV